MILYPIFTSEQSSDGLWSIQLDHDPQNEFEKFFDLVNNVEWLHHFFDRNKADLYSGYFGKVTMGEAVSRTLDEAGEMEDALYDFSERGFNAGNRNLQYLFKPLNNYEYTISTHQKSKTRIRRGWLRLYAIRLAENCYLITGGAIKLTFDMKRIHLQQELKKLEQSRQFLRSNGIDYPEDLNIYKDD